jgi:hypothetical protein
MCISSINLFHMTLLMIIFLVKPSIQAQSTLVHGVIGKSVHLRCSATAPFDTTLYWRRLDNNDISSQSTRFRQQQHIHGDLSHTTLYIKDIEKSDFGFYACFAESKAGRSKAVIELKEHHRPTTTTTSPIFEKDDLITTTSTSRTQLLKRNKSKKKGDF